MDFIKILDVVEHYKVVHDYEEQQKRHVAFKC